MTLLITNTPVEGRTYSLFAGHPTSGEYYRKIRALADDFTVRFGSAENVLSITGEFRNSGKKLWKFIRSADRENMGLIMKRLTGELSVFTVNTENYLHSLSWLDKIRDGRLSTTEDQYHRIMLEVELVNRINKTRFQRADRRIALLPHCLRDLSRECRSAKEGFDVVCKGCSGNCFIHALNDLLLKYRVEPFIWMEGSFRKLYLDMKKENQVLGIFGIACLAELKSGMEKCLKYDIPALGIPLDANRCARWMGDFYPNSVNMEEVEKLLKRMNDNF
ncbi:MAG: DUF116 domain-containing protein [Cyclobacteriaceae bacterium]|nr:DUF116 domain-containing protein [Cyclobacteriaceae bacterium]